MKIELVRIQFEDEPAALIRNKKGTGPAVLMNGETTEFAEALPLTSKEPNLHSNVTSFKDPVSILKVDNVPPVTGPAEGKRVPVVVKYE